MSRRLLSVLVATGLLLAAPAARGEEDAAPFFKQNCLSCHTIGGGRMTGPDLKDVLKRRDAAWLKRFIPNPKGMIDGGDPTAQQLLQEYRGVVMPQVPGLTPAKVDALLGLIEVESALPKSRFQGAGSAIPDRPFTEAEIREGSALFKGTRRLKNGGPSCISCHAVRGLGLLGGGRLGPDLSDAFVRLEGRKGLAGWLSSPPTPTMQEVFKAHPLDARGTDTAGNLDEVVLLVASLEQVSQSPPVAATSAPQLSFVLLGLCGAVGCLVAFDFIWGGRFRGVRRPLVRDAKHRGHA